MPSQIPRFEWNDTRQFSVVFSSQPSTPTLAIWGGSGNATLVGSPLVQASATNAYFAYFTMPASSQLLCVEWTASFAAGPVVQRTLIQTVKTTA